LRGTAATIKPQQQSPMPRKRVRDEETDNQKQRPRGNDTYPPKTTEREITTDRNETQRERHYPSKSHSNPAKTRPPQRENEVGVSVTAPELRRRTQLRSTGAGAT